MKPRITLLFFALVVIVSAGCVSWPTGRDEEKPAYLAFLERSDQATIGVAAFQNDLGLERDRWGRRRVFLAVSGSLFGLVPWPWDLRLIWSPPPIEAGAAFPASDFDPALASALAESLGTTGFRGRVIDPSTLEADPVPVGDLVAAARDAGCDALYVVAYNEFVDLRFRTETRRHQGCLLHRIKRLTGSALVPSASLFFPGDAEPALVRADTGRRGQVYTRNFWAPLCTLGRRSPLDGGTDSLVAFIHEVSGVTLEEARERCALFLAERDFTPKPLPGGAIEDEPDDGEEKTGGDGGEEGDTPGRNRS